MTSWVLNGVAEEEVTDLGCKAQMRFVAAGNQGQAEAGVFHHARV